MSSTDLATFPTRLVGIAGGVELETGEVGEGEPLILVCGTSQDLRLWLELVPVLSASRRVVLYNHRGIGASTRGEGPISMRSLAADLDALMTTLGIERADILGWSLGSAVAQEFAIAYPERARSIILVATWGRGSTFQRSILAALRHPWATGDIETALTALGIAYTEEFVNSPEYLPMMEALAPLFPTTPTGIATVVEQWDADEAHDTLDRLGVITAPTLVIIGERDLLTPATEGRKVAAAIPGARLQEFTGQGASHGLMFERAEEFLGAVLEFLSSR